MSNCYLTPITKVDVDKHYNSLWLYECVCGKNVIRTKHSVDTNTKKGCVVSCGCKKNQDKRKPFPIEIIPEKYKHLIEVDVQSCSLGNRHHAQWCSKVICPLCYTSKLLRNERVKYNILHYGCPWVCQKCGGVRSMNNLKQEKMLSQIKEEYLKSDLSWQEIANKYNLSSHWLSNRLGGKILTKIRQLQRRKESVMRMEKELIEYEKAYIEKQRQSLLEWEEEIKRLIK